MAADKRIVIVGNTGVIANAAALLRDLAWQVEVTLTSEDAIAVLETPSVKFAIVDSPDAGTRLKEACTLTPAAISVLLVSEQELPDDLYALRGRAFDECVSGPLSIAKLQDRLEAMEVCRVREESIVQLRKEVEHRNQLAAFIVHDMRNPLSAIIGNVQLMQEFGNSSDSMQTQCLDDLRELADRVLSMVDSLLEVEQMEAGRLQPVMTLNEIKALFEDFPRRYETALDARKIEIEMRVAQEIRANFDKDLVMRVVENLLDNAIRYAPRRGQILLSAVQSDGMVEIVVGNSGAAIPEEERTRIFERYYRLNNTRDDARVSRGLGLYFCQLVAEIHKGKVSVESRPGFPACFVLTFRSNSL